MSCKECDKFEAEGKIAYYRWGKANVGMIGCEKHLKELFGILDRFQNESDQPDTIEEYNEKETDKLLDDHFEKLRGK